ncbi:MAG: amino acid racemase [Patescibacteria group bacterium]|jgi:aspartate racemase
MKPTIGILGGIGPEASADFYLRLITKFQKLGIKNNQAYPHIILESIPAPELFLKKAEIKMYKKGVVNLENFGADFIVIVCNTAHVFYEEFKKLVKIPILNLKEEVHKELKRKKIKSILILGSSSTVARLYYFEGITTNIPNKKDQVIIDQIIMDYNAGKDNKIQKNKFIKIINKYKKYNLLVGCTELSMILKDVNFKYTDTMDILLGATMETWKKSKKR